MGEVRITLVGDDPELSEQLLAALLERGFDLASIRALGNEERRGERIQVDDVELTVETADAQALAGSDAVVFFGAGDLAERLIDVVPDGTIVLDATPDATLRPGATPVVPEVNGEQIGALARSGPVALASPAAVGLAVALAPLNDASRVRRVVTTVLQPASAGGREGIERLSRQSVSLMQGKALDEDLDPEHFAFNLRPHVGDDRTPWSAPEVHLAREIISLFGDPPIEIFSTSVRAPVFYGVAQAVYVETEGPLDPDEAERLLLRGRGLLVAGSTQLPPEEAAVSEEEPIGELLDLAPGPVEVAGSDAVHIAHVRGDPRREGAIAFWLCLDDQRKGVALNAIAALEIALRDVGA